MGSCPAHEGRFPVSCGCRRPAVHWRARGCILGSHIQNDDSPRDADDFESNSFVVDDVNECERLDVLSTNTFLAVCARHRDYDWLSGLNPTPQLLKELQQRLQNYGASVEGDHKALLYRLRFESRTVEIRASRAEACHAKKPGIKTFLA